MLKTKNLVILAVILVVLAGVSYLQKSSHRKSTSGSAVETVLAGEFTKESLGRITLGFGPDAEQVVLTSTPAGWQVDTAYHAAASNQRIDSLLRGLSNLAGEYRSDRAEVLGQYGLDEAASVKIRAFDQAGQPVLALDVGKTPDRMPGHFVRVPGSDRVFLSQKGVLGNLGIYGPPAAPESKYFLELQAVKEDRLDIERIVLEDGDGKLDLVKEFALEQAAPEAEGAAGAAGADGADGAAGATGAAAEPKVDRLTWEWLLNLDGETVLAKTKVDGVLGAVVSIRASDVADPTVPAADYGLEPPVRTATLHRQDGSQLVLEFGSSRPAEGEQAAGTYMRVTGEPEVWLVTDYTTRNIFKKLDDLKP